MDVLADTSVWIDRWRYGNDELDALLNERNILMHSLVLGELACGMPPRREYTLSCLMELPYCLEATSDEVMRFIEKEKLYGLGCGLVDISLLLSTLITTGSKLWTLDKRLAELAKRFGIQYQRTTSSGRVIHEEQATYQVLPL